MVGGGVVCCCSLVLPHRCSKEFPVGETEKKYDLLEIHFRKRLAMLRKAAALWNL